jgi:hypothetical protein
VLPALLALPALSAFPAFSAVSALPWSAAAPGPQETSTTHIINMASIDVKPFFEPVISDSSSGITIYICSCTSSVAPVLYHIYRWFFSRYTDTLQRFYGNL